MEYVACRGDRPRYPNFGSERHEIDYVLYRIYMQCNCIMPADSSSPRVYHVGQMPYHYSASLPHATLAMAFGLLQMKRFFPEQERTPNFKFVSARVHQTRGRHSYSIHYNAPLERQASIAVQASLDEEHYVTRHVSPASIKNDRQYSVALPTERPSSRLITPR